MLNKKYKQKAYSLKGWVQYMKIIKKIWMMVFSVIIFSTSFAVTNLQDVKAYTTYNKLEIENMQLNKARIKTGSSDSNGKHVETYWEQSPLDTYDKLTDITFARYVFEAEEAGEYTFQIHCKNESGSGTIGIKLYANGTDYDINVSGNAYQTVNKTVNLDKGKNSIVLAWVNWGYFDYINYPSELKPVSYGTETKYCAFESALNEIQLTPTSGFHNPETVLYTAPIEYNSGDEEWQGAATFTVDAAAGIKSIDLNYYVTEYNNGKAQLAMSINGGKEVKLDLSGTKTNTKLTYQISTKTLTEAGFKPGKTNTIKFRQASSTGGQVGLYDIELKEAQVEEETPAPSKANRYEAENAYIMSGAKIKLTEGDEENWSKGSYIGEFAPASITKPSQIDEYCSNIGYVQYKVNAEQKGYYKVTLGYATEENMSVYVTSGYEWSKVNLTSTGKWCDLGEKEAYVYLKKGSNSIWVTGPTTEKGWVNYDYIDVEFDEAADLDTKDTVLLLDNGASSSNSKVIDSKGKDADKDKDKDEDSETDNDEENSNLISPKTGVPFMAGAAVILFAGAAFTAVYKKKVSIK